MVNKNNGSKSRESGQHDKNWGRKWMTRDMRHPAYWRWRHPAYWLRMSHQGIQAQWALHNQPPAPPNANVTQSHILRYASQMYQHVYYCIIILLLYTCITGVLRLRSLQHIISKLKTRIYHFSPVFDQLNLHKSRVAALIKKFSKTTWLNCKSAKLNSAIYLTSTF